MRSLPGFVFSAAAMLMTGAAIVSAEPARAAVSVNIDFGFNTFHDRLADRGRWLRSSIWGDVWQPRRRLVGDNFQPYSNGYWEYTDEYGWYWVSDDPFDDVVYHYGRWVYDPDLQWLWIPGYTWSPGWVVWREGDGYSGWLPMPPDEAFVSGNGLSLGMNFGSWGVNFFGYSNWYGNRVDPDRFWVFVDNRNLANRDYRRFVVPRERAKVLITNTRNVTKFEVVNNRVVNRSIDVKIVERASGRRITPVPAKQVIKANAIITTVDESNRIRQRERAEHPIRADFQKSGGAMGGANQPGNATGRPDGAMTGGADQANGTAEGGKRDRNNPSGGANGNAAAGASGTTASGGEQPADNGKATHKPRNASNGSTDNGAMTGPEGGGQPNGTSPSDSAPNNATKPDHRNNANAGGGTDNGMQNATPPNGTPNRAPRNNSGAAMTGPSDNTPSQPAEPKHHAASPGGTGMNEPAGASPSAQQPDNPPKKKNPKHNPPDTTPDSGTPQ